MAEDTTGMLGKVLKEHQDRDAIHVAVISVVAGKLLCPGDHVNIIDIDTMTVGQSILQPIGIIDPFLKDTVKKGDICWLFLYPNTITSLKHKWTHPAFSEAPDTSKVISEKWMKDYGFSLGLSKSELMNAADDYIKHGNYLCHRGPRFESETIPDEFWNHYEVLTETLVEHSKRGSFC